MTDQFQCREPSLSAPSRRVAIWPNRAVDRTDTADRISIAGRRSGITLLVASAVVINAWALFPSPDGSGRYVPTPDTSTPLATGLNPAGDGVTNKWRNDSRAHALRLMDAELISAKPGTNGLITAGYSSPAVAASPIPLRSKLLALLMLLQSQLDDVDQAGLEAKLQSLLQLPDFVLARLMEHPDLVGLGKMLDEAVLGRFDLLEVRTELGKVDVSSVPGTSEQIRVININGKPEYTVRELHINNGGTEGSPTALVALSSQVGQVVAFQVVSPAGLTATVYSLTPSAVELPPSPALLPPPPPPPPTLLPPPPPPPSVSESSKTSEQSAGALQTSVDVPDAGIESEPKEIAPERSTDKSPEPDPPRESSTPSETDTHEVSTTADTESHAGAGDAPSGGDTQSPNNQGSGGASSAGDAP